MSWYTNLTLAQVDEAPVERPRTPGAAPQEGGTDATTAIEGEPGADGVAPRQGPDMSMLWMIAVFILLMWVMVFLPQRREKKKHAAMLSQLKKGDRIQTIGGVLGTIVEVRDREIIVKVDESNNTRMRFTRAAIQGVVEESKE